MEDRRLASVGGAAVAFGFGIPSQLDILLELTVDSTIFTHLAVQIGVSCHGVPVTVRPDVPIGASGAMRGSSRRLRGAAGRAASVKAVGKVVGGVMLSGSLVGWTIAVVTVSLPLSSESDMQQGGGVLLFV